MANFEQLRKIVLEDAEKEKEKKAFWIQHGYCTTWAEENRKESDEGLKACSTPLRWGKYQAGEISREQAVELATRREWNRIGKATTKKLEQLDRAANTPIPRRVEIIVEWVRSQTWGYNPHAYIMAGGEEYTGTASGCGYDKESAAVSSALNQIPGVLHALYALKDQALSGGISDFSCSACTGRDNRNCCGYGAGYGAIPSFEGGVGMPSILAVLGNCGYEVRFHHGKRESAYILEMEG